MAFTPIPAGAQEGDAAVAADAAPQSSVTGDIWLKWGYRALGPGYSLIFLILSFTLMALLVMNFLTARRDNVCPAFLVEGFENHLNERRYQEAYDLAKGDESFLGLVLSAGLGKLSAATLHRVLATLQEMFAE